MRVSRSILFVATLFVIVALSSFEAEAAKRKRKPKAPRPPKVTTVRSCGKVSSVQGKFIYKNAAPLRVGGPGTRLRGFREEPTLICRTGVCSKKGASIFAKNGKKLGWCPFTGAHGFYGRYRCTMSTRALRRKLVKRTKSPQLFFRVNKGKCIQVPDAGACYGSWKGRCNQTLR